MLAFSPPHDLSKDLLVGTLMISHRKRKLTLLSLLIKQTVTCIEMGKCENTDDHP